VQVYTVQHYKNKPTMKQKELKRDVMMLNDSFLTFSQRIFVWYIEEHKGNVTKRVKLCISITKIEED